MQKSFLIFICAYLTFQYIRDDFSLLIILMRQLKPNFENEIAPERSVKTTKMAINENKKCNKPSA